MQPSFLHRLFWGLVFVAVGAVFLLNQTGTVHIDIGDLFSDFWPVFLILIGLQGLLLQRSGGVFWNAILLLIGVVFLGRNLGFLTWDPHDLFRMIGPVVLILIGLGIMARGSGSKRRRADEPDYGWNPVTPPQTPGDPRPPMGPPPAPPLTDDPNAPFSDAYAGSQAGGAGAADPTSTGPGTGSPASSPNASHHHHGHSRFYERMERRNHRREERRQRMEQRHRCRNNWRWDPHATHHSRFIGDVYIGQEYWELRPMNISHFIGDTTLDLTKAQIPVGETRVYVSCFIGDVKVFVPNDPGIGVQVMSSSLIGDVRVWDQQRGGFFNQLSVESPGFSDAEKRVVLIASAFIGDVRVTKVG
jgi:lia operon protein LiaF